MQNGHSTVDEFTEILENDALLVEGTNNLAHGQDCSGLVSDVWENDDRLTTNDILYVIDRKIKKDEFIVYKDKPPKRVDIQFIELSDYSQLAPGDAVVKDGHIRLVSENTGSSIIVIEESPTLSRIKEYSYDELAGDGYLPITKDFGG